MLKLLKLSVVISLLEKTENTLLTIMNTYKETDTNNKEINKYIEKLSKQLISLKLAKGHANNRRHPLIFGKIKIPFIGKSNNYYIYKLSEEKRISKILNYDYKDRVKSIKEKLSWFNNNTYLLVNVYNDLNLT